MLKNREAIEQQIYEILERGDSLPDHLQHWVESDPQLQSYTGQMQNLLQAFEETDRPAIPPHLNDEVMRFIENREQQNAAQREPNRPKFATEVWLALVDFFGGFRIPHVLKREAWPTAIATLVVVWNVLIVPQVEAGRLNEWMKHPWVVQVEQYTEELRTQSRQTAERLAQYTESWVRKAMKEFEPSNSSVRMEKTRPYLEE